MSTSQIFAVEAALTDRLEALSFSTFQGEPPLICPGDPDMSGEYIDVVVSERSEITRERLGCEARDEALLVDVVHRLLRPNIKTRQEVRDRLAEVSAVIESITFEQIAALVTEEIHDGDVVGVLPAISPGSAGWIGMNTVTFRFIAAI